MAQKKNCPPAIRATRQRCAATNFVVLYSNRGHLSYLITDTNSDGLASLWFGFSFSRHCFLASVLRKLRGQRKIKDDRQSKVW